MQACTGSVSTTDCELALTPDVVLQTNLCKLKTYFAQPIGGCVRALKDNMS